MEKILIESAQIIVPALVSLLAALLSLVLYEARNLLIQKIGAEKAQALEHMASDAVAAAQQYLQTKDGAAKKAYAMAYLQSAIDARGIKISVDQLSTLIEATVARAKDYAALWGPDNEPPANDPEK